MSYFNEDQQDYMEDLSKLPSIELCKCGWYRRGECPNCVTSPEPRKPNEWDKAVNMWTATD